MQRKTLPEGEAIDRAVMWKVAREDKNGSVTEEMAPIAKLIVRAILNTTVDKFCGYF